jgi:DNA-binding MarR family transcriptional regulator
MTRLNHAPEILKLAAELGAGAAAPVDSILGYCRRRIDGWVAEAGGVTGIDALESLVTQRLKQLSAHLGLAHSTVSGIVDRLQERGLVERQANETDKRVTRIAVTRKVRDFVRDTLPGLSVHPLVEAIARAKPAQRRTIMKGLKALRKVLEDG